MRLSVRAARVHVEIDFFQRQRGSVWDGDIESGCTAARSHLEMESDEAEEKLLPRVEGGPEATAAALGHAVSISSRSAIA